MKQNLTITKALVGKVLATVDAGLSSGLGSPEPGSMCVEAAVCYAMDLPHGDEPPCVHPLIRSLKIRLNDSAWSSPMARAKGMRRIAVLQLGTADCGFDPVDFAKRLALFTAREILSIALLAADMPSYADACSRVTTLEEAAAAEAAAAAYAAEAARSAAAAAAYAARSAESAESARSAESAEAAAWSAEAAAYAARSAAYAARSAAWSARDKTLAAFAEGIENILIDMNVPAVKFLKLLHEPA